MDILYHDDHIVAVNKPTGLLVHRSLIDRHETRFALQLVRDKLGRHVYPVHRLDRPTSGILLFALSSEAAQRLAESFATRQVRKSYLTVVRGIPPEEGVIDYPLVEEPDRLMKLKPDRIRRDGGLPAESQPAVTAYRRLADVELPVTVGRYPTSRYSLLEIHPHTGRRHQIRRHLKHIFHPVIGDTTYGEGRHNRLFQEELGCCRMLLAAMELSFPHPSSGALTTVTASVDDAFAALLDQLGWQDAIPPHWLP